MPPFRQVDVFSTRRHGGNPLAVVHDAEHLDEESMQRFAHWTNLSETTFLLPPTIPGADYRVRIFTGSEELPFAGHPTLGSAHAWLEAGGEPARDGVVVQECGAGLVAVRRGEHLAFAAPPLLRSGPVGDADRAAIARALAIDDADIVDLAWIDNGPGWVGVLLRDAEAVLGVRPDPVHFGDRDIGIVGLHREGADVACEVRAFFLGHGVVEDPVTGSLNAGLAQWLAGDRLPTSYVAAQGTALGRHGRVHVERDADDTVWVGGATRTVVRGEVDL